MKSKFIGALFLLILASPFGLHVAHSDEITQEEFLAGMQKTFNTPGHAQYFFARIHPIGKATSMKVHAAEMLDREGKVVAIMSPNRVALRLVVTIYWKGPVTTDGFTKLSWTYDAESERVTDCRILATNGITNSDAVKALAGALVESLKE